MKYSINKSVCFDMGKGIISLSDDESVFVQLSRPGLRLLHELVIHSGNTLSREHLLKSVWENHGLIPSNSSLSNHISYLRKSFLQLGMEEEIIVTAPKEGFRLQAEVTLHATDSAEQNEVTNETIINDASQENITIPTYPDDEKRVRKRRITQVFRQEIFSGTTVTLAAILLLGLLTMHLPFTESIFQNGEKRYSAIGFCKIIDLDSGKGIKEKDKMDIVKAFIVQKNINCINQKSTIYVQQTDITRDEKSGQKSLFFVQCFTGQREKNLKCESYFSLSMQTP